MRSDVKFTPRERWLALAMLLAVLAAAYAVLVHPWFTAPLLRANAELEVARERGARVRAQLAQAGEIAKRLDQARASGAGQTGFLPEASAELATAALVQRLESVVAEASPGNRSCAVSNRSPLPPQSGDGEPYSRVVVQVRLRCGDAELAGVLDALENGSARGEPQLFVDNLDVLAQRYAGNARQPGGSGGLEVSFDLYGYLRPRTAEGGSDAP